MLKSVIKLRIHRSSLALYI